jgi:hypothetical protein
MQQNYFKFFKIKNKMRPYFLDRKQLAEAFVMYVHAARNSNLAGDLLAERFIQDENGLHAAQLDRQAPAVREFLQQIFADYQRKKFEYLYTPFRLIGKD